jgi:hypothetical protein
MVGYSGTPLAKKMGIVEGSRVLTLGAPNEFAEWLAPLPEDVTVSSRIRAADVVVMFCVTEADVTKTLLRATGAIGPTGSIWLCWPKKASGIESPLQNRATMIALMFPPGLVDVKVGAVSEVWSGLKFVVRKENRASWHQ